LALHITLILLRSSPVVSLKAFQSHRPVFLLYLLLSLLPAAWYRCWFTALTLYIKLYRSNDGIR
jgi:hypothetical protein